MNTARNYENFVFYGSFAESVNTLYDVSAEKGNMLLKSIMDYGTTGVINDDEPVTYAILANIIPNIDAAKTKYAKAINGGNKGGAPTRINYDKVYELHDRGYSNSDISAALECSQKQVRTILAKRTKPNLSGRNELKPDIDKEVDTYIEKESEKNIYMERENQNDIDVKEENYNDGEWEFGGYNSDGTPYYKSIEAFGQDDDGILLYDYKDREGYEDDDGGLPF